MSVIRRILKSSENIFSKNWTVIYANTRNEFASSSKKIEVPSPPKRPLTAYMLFLQESRGELLKKKPDLSVTEQMKTLAKQWTELTLESKKPFEIKAREKTLLYGEQHKHYYESLSDEQKEELARVKAEKRKARALIRLKRALRINNIPKPARSAYNLFVQSLSQDKSNIEGKDFFKEAAQKWKSLSDAEKEALEKKAETEKVRYSSEMMKWREKMVKEGNEKLLKAYDELPYRGKFVLADTTEKKPKRVVERKSKATTPKPSPEEN